MHGIKGQRGGFGVGFVVGGLSRKNNLIFEVISNTLLSETKTNIKFFNVTLTGLSCHIFYFIVSWMAVGLESRFQRLFLPIFRDCNKKCLTQKRSVIFCMV